MCYQFSSTNDSLIMISQEGATSPNSAGRSKEAVLVVVLFHEAFFMWPDRDGLIDA